MRGKNIATLARELGFDDYRPLSSALKAFIESEKISRPQFAKADDTTIRKVAKAFVKRHARKHWGVVGRPPFYPDDEEAILNNLVEILNKQRRNTFDALQACKRKRVNSVDGLDDIENEEDEHLDTISIFSEAQNETNNLNEDGKRNTSVDVQDDSLRPATEENTPYLFPPEVCDPLGLSLEDNRPSSEISLALHEEAPLNARVTTSTPPASTVSDSLKRKFDEVEVSRLSSHLVGSVAEVAGSTSSAILSFDAADIAARYRARMQRTPFSQPPPRSPSIRVTALSEDTVSAHAPKSIHKADDSGLKKSTEMTTVVSTNDMGTQSDIAEKKILRFGDTDAQYSVDRVELENIFLSHMSQFESMEFDVQIDLREARRKGNDREMHVAEGRLKQLRQMRVMIRDQLMSRGATEEF